MFEILYMASAICPTSAMKDIAEVGNFLMAKKVKTTRLPGKNKHDRWSDIYLLDYLSKDDVEKIIEIIEQEDLEIVFFDPDYNIIFLHPYLKAYSAFKATTFIKQQDILRLIKEKAPRTSGD